mgnify:CR=1 FL=1
MKSLGLFITVVSFLLISCGKEINTRTQETTAEQNQTDQQTDQQTNQQTDSARPDSKQNDEEDETICPTHFDPICGQPPMPECPTQFCTQVLPQPQTYSNECELEQDRARVISQGRCPSNTP